MPKKPVRMMACWGLLFYPKYCKVYYRDAEIDPTKTEYDIFNLLISNPNQPLLPNMIYRKVWGKEYEQAAQQDLWQHISRLRNKIKDVNHEGCIESRRSRGCSFSIRAKN